MKKIIIIMLCALAAIPNLTLQGQCTVNRFCLSFANPVVSAGQFEFDIVMASNMDFGLGYSNIQFKYNNAAISTPTLVSTTLPLVNYETPIVTNPNIPSLGAKIGSLNIVPKSSQTGKLIPAAGTTIARVRFIITNPAMSSNLTWYYNGGTTQTIVYDDAAIPIQLCSVTNNDLCLAPLSTVLPIDLLSFNLVPKEKSFDLLWESQQEVNFKGFSLERSDLDARDFKEIAFEASNGNARKNNYLVTDNTVKSNVTYFYRLKMIDLDGGYKYTNTLSGKLTSDVNSFNVYPNPISKSDDLNITTEFTGSTQLSIWDNNSKLLLQKDFNLKTTIDLKNFSTGVYFYKLTADGVSKLGNFTVVE